MINQYHSPRLSASCGGTMPLMRLILVVATLALAGCGRSGNPADLREVVRRTELAFAKSLADRDPAAFASFLSAEAVFLGDSAVARGPQQVIERWRPFFAGPQAPFSWAPERVEVLDSGTLAMTSGPVLDPSGKRIGTFNSVWRREGRGWRIVLDNGCPACKCGAIGN